MNITLDKILRNSTAITNGLGIPAGPRNAIAFAAIGIAMLAAHWPELKAELKDQNGETPAPEVEQP